MAEIIITPPHLVSELMDDQSNEQNPLLIDLYGLIEKNRWLFEGTLIFNPIEFDKTSGDLVRDFYIGITKCSLTLNLMRNATITDHTPEQEVMVERKLKKTVKRSYKVALKPKLELEAAGAKTKVETGEAEGEWGGDNERETTYQFREFTVKPTLSIGNSKIKFDIQNPKGQSIIREDLYGNMFFFIDVNWNKEPRNGSIELKISHSDFFNQDGKVPRGWNRLGMKITARKKKLVQNPSGLQFNFTVNE